MDAGMVVATLVLYALRLMLVLADLATRAADAFGPVLAVVTQLALGVLANCLSVWFVAKTALWLGRRYVRRRTLGLRRFFGVGEGAPLTVYLARIKVFESIGIDGIQRSYQGSAMVRAEKEEGDALAGEFLVRFESGGEAAAVLGDLLSMEAQVRVVTSPLPHEWGHDPLVSGPFVAVGSPAYNYASRVLEEDFSPHHTFGRPNFDSIWCDGSPLKDACAFAERVPVGDGSMALFYVAGTHERSTVDALRYLRTHWQQMDAQCAGCRSYAVRFRWRSDESGRLSRVVPDGYVRFPDPAVPAGREDKPGGNPT